MFENNREWRLDLHVHSPLSFCYDDRSATPDDIVGAALANGMDAIAVTDHNTVSGIDEIREAAAHTDLVIFPGIELSTSGGHVVSLFDPDMPVSRLQDIVQCLGIPPEIEGDGSKTISMSTASVFKTVSEMGGLAIAAHIERWPSGFLETEKSRKEKMAIHGSEFLSALEITIPGDKSKWNNGQMPGYTKKYPCVQSSDAHAPDQIGRRHILVRMNRIDLQELMSAFTHHGSRIRFPSDGT